MEEILARFDKERFRFANDDGDVVIGTVFNTERKYFTIKFKEVDGDEIEYGMTYRWWGKWVSYRNKRTGEQEQQFFAGTWTKTTPLSPRGIKLYLAKAPAIGSIIAGRIFEAYHEGSVAALREKPDEVAKAIRGLSKHGASEASDFLKAKQKTEEVQIEMIDLLSGRKFPRDTWKKCVSRFGNHAPAIYRHNPYLLMQFRGCGFGLTDAMYLDLGHPPEAIKRQALCMADSIARDGSGSTWFPVAMAEESLREKIAGTKIKPKEALQLALRRDYGISLDGRY